MKTTRLIPLLLIGLLSACAGLPGNKTADIDALLLASGVDGQLKTLEQPLDPDSLEGPMALVPNELISAINSTVSASLKPDDIRAGLKTALNRNMKADELRAARRFFESKTGQQVVAAEGGKLNRNSFISAAQEEQLRTLDSATGASQVVSRLAEQSFGSAVDALTKNSCLGIKDIPFSGLLGGVVKKSQMAVVRQSVRSMMNSRYGALSSEELNAYLKFAQSPAGQNYFKSRNEAFSEAASKAGDDVAKLLAQELNKGCSV